MAEKLWHTFLRFKKTPIWRFCISLKLAVFVMLCLAIGSAVGTFYESWYDTPTAQYVIYKSWWFMGIQGLLAINIFCVAMDRYPWKRRQIPFLMAHLGILMLIWGSALTYLYGIDGSMLVEEGNSNAAVSFQDLQLTLWREGKIQYQDIPWQPPNVDFKAVDTVHPDWRADRYISRAEGSPSFVAAHENHPIKSAAAIHIRLTAGPPMNLKEQFWLWGRNRWASRPLGPASIEMPGSPEAEEQLLRSVFMKPTRMEIWPRNDGSVDWMAYSQKGSKVKMRSTAGKVKGAVFHPGWMDLKVEVLDYLPQAVLNTHFSRSRLQYGEGSGEPALRLVNRKNPEHFIWLGQGDYVELNELQNNSGSPTYLGFMPKRVSLPFQIRLDRFEVEYYDGTTSPKEYSSVVTVQQRNSKMETDVSDSPSFRQRISMNQPLVHEGYTFYQSSFVPGFPRPTVSIFSVNQDPGRWWKYWGSIILVLGAILLFVVRFYRFSWLS